MYDLPSPFAPPRSPNHLLRLTATFGIILGSVITYAALRIRLLPGESLVNGSWLTAGNWWEAAWAICCLLLAEIVSAAILPLAYAVVCIPAIVRLEWKGLLGLAGVAFAIAIGFGFFSPPITSW